MLLNELISEITLPPNTEHKKQNSETVRNLKDHPPWHLVAPRTPGFKDE